MENRKWKLKASVLLQAAEKAPTAVILSRAKDLHLVVFKKILQMLRSA